MTASTGTSLLKQHPLSAAFPSMPEDELDALAEDIKRSGQREPGVLFEGMVLDGWHRYLACLRAEVEFRSVTFDGADPVAFVLSKNLLRRHLSASQRAAAIVAAHNWKPRGRQSEKTGNFAGLSEKPLSEKDMARAAEVSERTIREAKEAQRVGLSEEVKAGKLSAHAAAEVAKLPAKKRDKAIEAIKSGEEPALPKPKAVIASREVEKLYESVKAELTDVQGKYADLLEKNVALSDIARELNDKLEAFETTEPDEQQKLIADLQLKLRRKEAEIDRLRVQLRDANNKNNELVREVKKLQRRAGLGQ